MIAIVVSNSSENLPANSELNIFSTNFTGRNDSVQHFLY